MDVTIVDKQTQLTLPAEPQVATTNTGMDPSKKAELINRIRNMKMGFNPTSYVVVNAMNMIPHLLMRLRNQAHFDPIDFRFGGCALCALTNNGLGFDGYRNTPYIQAAKLLNITPGQAREIELCTYKASDIKGQSGWAQSWSEVADNMERRL
jgi:hypothetical protein